MFHTLGHHDHDESHRHRCLLATTVRLHVCSDVSMVDDIQEEHDKTRPEKYRHSVTSGTREMNSVRVLFDQVSCVEVVYIYIYNFVL